MNNVHVTPLTIAVVTVPAGLVIWLLLVCWRNHRANLRYGFSLQGGRAGVIEYRADGRTAHLPWEGLCGKFDLALYIDSAGWVQPTAAPFTPEERTAILKQFDAWARASRMRYELVPNSIQPQ